MQYAPSIPINTGVIRRKKEGNPYMQKTINHLIQLQDLIIARAQQEASMPGAQLGQLDESIETMLAELPSSLATQFTKLNKKSPISIVPLSGQVCTACGISLPVSFVQAVKKQGRIHQCTSCARLVYYSNTIPRATARKTRRADPPKVGIERFSSPELMIPKLSATTRDEALAELCRKLEEEGFVENSDSLIDVALRREAIVTTAVDHGLAFPHVRGVEGGGLALVLGIHKKGIKFGHPSGKLTRLIFFMVIPTAASAFYLKLLSGLTQTFRKKEARDKLSAATTNKALWKALARTTRSSIP